MKITIARRLVAEALGTALLVATVVGSGVMAASLTSDVGLALLANTLATGAILAVLIPVFGPISGAQFNPAVTLVLLLRRQLSVGEALLHVLVQIAGGLIGTWAAHLMFAHNLFETSTHVRTGAPQWFAECVATFGLVLVILGAKPDPDRTGWLVGLYIVAAYWFTASTSFANPAVTIARSFTDTFAGIRPLDAPLFIVAQLAGAVLAFLVARWLFNSSEIRPA